MLLRASRMSRRDARPVVMPERMPRSLSVKCTLLSALLAAKKQEYPLSRVRIVLFIAVSALHG